MLHWSFDLRIVTIILTAVSHLSQKFQMGSNITILEIIFFNYLLVLSHWWVILDFTNVQFCGCVCRKVWVPCPEGQPTQSRIRKPTGISPEEWRNWPRSHGKPWPEWKDWPTGVGSCLTVLNRLVFLLVAKHYSLTFLTIDLNLNIHTPAKLKSHKLTGNSKAL